MQRELYSDAAGTPQLALHVTREELASVLGVTGNMVNKLTREGLPRRSRGRYELGEAVRWYVGRWRDAADRSNTRDDSDERKALLQAQTAKYQQEAARLAGQLIPRHQVSSVLQSVAGLVASTLDGWPQRVAAELADLDTPAGCMELLRRECTALRTTVADLVVDLAAAQDGGDDPPAPAQKNGRRVGRRASRDAGGRAGAGTVAH